MVLGPFFNLILVRIEIVRLILKNDSEIPGFILGNVKRVGRIDRHSARMLAINVAAFLSGGRVESV
jgi:hypothetical protein